MKLTTITALGLYCSVLAPVAFGAPGLRLVDDGSPNAVIVLSENPSPAAVEGAEILSDHLFQISGARLETVPEDRLDDAARSGIRILVGESESAAALGADADDLGPGGILIRTYPRALVLLGPDRRTPTDTAGTRYAVTTFLEDALGVRFLWPGELGKVVPKRRTIEIAAIDHQYTPTIQQRRIRMASGYGDRKANGVQRLGFGEADYIRLIESAMVTESRDGGWAGWHRLGGSLRLAGGHAFGHLWEKHKDAHPEWFALQADGTRDQSISPNRSRLCISNPELIKEIAREKIEQLNRSETGSVSIGPNDGGQTGFCRCPDCNKLDPPNRRELASGRLSVTDRFVYFWNEIAKQVAEVHPEASLTADAYGNYSAPPVERKLHPNIAIRYVGIKYNNEEKRQQDLDDWDAWSRAVERIYFRPNVLLSGRRQGTPFLFPHKMAADFKYMAGRSLIGTDFDSCCHNWSTQGLNYYVCAKLHWNPNLNIDELIDDFCRSGFGSGAEMVKQYLLRIEDLTDDLAVRQLKYTDPYTPEVIDELRGYLEEAATQTADETEAHQRVEFYRSGLEYSDAYAAAFRIIREHQESGDTRVSNETKQRIREALDKNWLASRDIFENHHLSVNVATVAYGSWSYFARFGWSEPSEEIRKKFE